MPKSLTSTEDKLAFARNWLVHQTYAGTARACGISAKQARTLRKDPEVAAFIEDRERAAADKLLITHEYVLGSIKEVAESAREDGDYSAALKGYDQLGKHLSLFTDKTEVDAKMSITVTTGVPDQDPTQEDEE